MKRSTSLDDVECISSDDSDSEVGDANGPRISKKSRKEDGRKSGKDITSIIKRKTGAINYDALKRHGYKGGPSVLNIPPPNVYENVEQDWSWSKGKFKAGKDVEETFEERERTRAAVADGAKLLDATLRNDKKHFSFSQKEKRKRELGQASRGKSYVEEEKRLLRDQGVYSGFDS